MLCRKYFEVKNKADFILSLVILIVALPFMLLIAILLAAILKSFPLIIQKRGITEDNRVFNIYKFRTMKSIPDNQINSENILFKKDLSEYVPTFCRWLRKTGFDELPQIFNVLKGEMSLVGPRPLTISDLKVLRNDYPQYYQIRNSIVLKPGITGIWQVFGNRDEGIKNLINLDLLYNGQISFLVDLRILLSTIVLIIRGKHTDAIFPCKSCNEEWNSLINDNFLIGNDMQPDKIKRMISLEDMSTCRFTENLPRKVETFSFN